VASPGKTLLPRRGYLGRGDRARPICRRDKFGDGIDEAQAVACARYANVLQQLIVEPRK
jgi:hypothetical protein